MNKVAAYSIGIGVPVAIGLGIYFVFVRQTKSGSTLWKKWTGSPDLGSFNQPQIGVGQPPLSQPKTQSGFPLNIGSTGDLVKQLQTNLNKMGNNLTVDGIFGNLTLGAVKKAGYDAPITQDKFNAIKQGYTAQMAAQYISTMQAINPLGADGSISKKIKTVY